MPFVIMAAKSWGLVDEPDPRKVHIKPVPRVGGIAIAFATVGVAITGLMMLQQWGRVMPPELFSRMITILAAAGFIFLVGFVDDVRSVSPRFKALALVAAALAVCGSGTTIGTLYISNQPWLNLGYLDWVITVGWIVGVAVAINFIDGLDGLAGGIVLLACLVLAGFAIAAGNLTVAMLPLALGGSLAGFLIFNSHPARVFMGDSGSFFIGFLIATAIVLANPILGTMEAALVPGLALSIPIVDTLVTMIRRRYIERRSLFAPERGHIHHHLLDQGLNQRQAVFALYAVSIICVGIGMLAWLAQGWATAGSLSLLVVVLWGAFRLAGSVRTREMLSAIRAKRERDRVSSRHEQAFHDLQMEFRSAEDFSGWWQTVCRAAERLEFASVSLDVLGRDGATRNLSWSPTEPMEPGITMLTAELPIAERRRSEPLMARVQIVATKSSESAAQRLAHFARLMSDHSVASLPTTARLARSDGGVASHHGPREKPLIRQGQHERPNGMVQQGPLEGKRVAVVHDFLYVYAGAEKVLEQIIGTFPDADLFALFDFLPEDQRGFLRGKPVKTSFLQKMPLAQKKHRAYLPLMPLAVEQLDLSGYDVVISSSYIAAKGVITGPDQIHVCYCHSPARYAWDLQHQYLDQQRIGFSPKGILARTILHYIRSWDARSSLGVDKFIANSSFVAQRIQKVYRRDAAIIHPPVDTDFYCPGDPTDTDHDAKNSPFYLAASRLVPYKRIDLIVEAFNRMPDKRLVVVGSGPEYDRIVAAAGPNVQMLGYQSDEELRHYMRLAKAFVFAAEEDFGIMPVEAMACGTPVIAYGHGGARDSVTPGQTGIFFDRQNPDSIIQAVTEFEELSSIDVGNTATARFSQKRFRDEVEASVLEACATQNVPVSQESSVGTKPSPSASVTKTNTDLADSLPRS